MKNRILFSLVVAVIPFFSFAQIDDMYFVPQKETKEQKEQQTRSQPSMHAISESVATTASNEHVQNNARDVDEYNRRYRWENDSTAANEEETANEENAPTAFRDWKKIINTPNEFFVSTLQLSALRSAVLYTGTYVMVPIPYIGMYMMMDFTHTLILAVGIGDLPFPTRGDGDYTILFGGGEALGMPDGMILGIGDHTGIIRIGDIPVMDGIHQDRLLDPV